jgi:hypothetical protein
MPGHLRQPQRPCRSTGPRPCGPARCTGSPAGRRPRPPCGSAGTGLPGSACCSTARPAAQAAAPASRANCVSSIASRWSCRRCRRSPARARRAVLTATRISWRARRRHRRRLARGADATMPSVPSATCQSISARYASRSSAVLVHRRDDGASCIGVTTATMLPVIMLKIAAHGEVCMARHRRQEPEQLPGRGLRHLTAVAPDELRPSRFAVRLRQRKAYHRRARGKQRQPQVVVVAPRDLAPFHATRRAPHGAQTQALAACAPRPQAYYADGHLSRRRKSPASAAASRSSPAPKASGAVSTRVASLSHPATAGSSAMPA